MDYIAYFILTFTYIGLLYLYINIPYLMKRYSDFIRYNVFKDINTELQSDKDYENKINFRKSISHIYLPILIWFTLYFAVGIFIAIYTKDFWILNKTILFIFMNLMGLAIYTSSINFMLNKGDSVFKKSKKYRLKDLAPLENRLTNINNRYLKYFYIGLILHLLIILMIILIYKFVTMIPFYGLIVSLLFVLWITSFIYFSIKVMDVYYKDNIKSFNQYILNENDKK